MGKTKSAKVEARLSLTEDVSAKLKQVQTKLKIFNRSLHNVGRQFEGAMSKLTVPIAAIAGGGFFSMRNTMQQFLSVGDAIDKAAIRAGVGAEALQKLRYAAGLGGMEAEEMDNALAKLGTQMGAMASGQGDKLVNLFDQLGIKYKEANGKMRNSAEVMRELADAVKANQDPTARLRMLSEIFGDKLGKKLIPVLEGGAAGLDDVAKKAEELGIILDAKAIKQAASLNDEWSNLQLIFRAVSFAIGSKLAPAIQNIVVRLQNAFKANKELIAQKIDKYVRQFTEALEKVDFGKLIDGFFKAIDFASQLFDKIGGLKTIFIAWGAIIGGRILTNIWGLGSAIVNVGKAFTVAFGPWGIAIAAIAGAFLLMYNRSEKFRNACDRLCTFLAKVFKPVLDVIASVLEFVADYFGFAIDQGLEFIDSIGDAIGGMFDDPIASLEKTGKALLKVIFSPLEFFRQKLKSVVADLDSYIPNWFKDLFGGDTNVSVKTETSQIPANQTPIPLKSPSQQAYATVDLVVEGKNGAKTVIRQSNAQGMGMNIYQTGGYSYAGQGGD